MLFRSYGQIFDASVTQKIINALKPSYIKGFSLLGGEPFEPQNQPELADLLEKIKCVYPEKDIWCYTGYLFDTELVEHRVGEADITDRMLSCIDIIVDGEFQIENKILDLRFRGSTNQRIIDVKASLEIGEIVIWQDEFE